LRDIVSKLEQSNEYKEWRASHQGAFLAHAFVMLDEPNKNVWQIGYFDDSNSLMSTFIVNDASIKAIPDQEVLKTEKQILPLTPDDVQLPVAEALAAAEKTRIQHYPQEKPLKTFFIIQNTEAHGQVFNITFFTASLKTINIKISTKNGKVEHHSIQAIAAFG